MSKKKISQSVRRDFAAYLHWRDVFGRDFDPFPDIEVAKGRATALEAFGVHESQGVLIPACQPLVLRAALKGKALLNWQIKQWAESLADRIAAGGIWPSVAKAEVAELVADFPWLPAWVWAAVEHQAEKHAAAIRARE